MSDKGKLILTRKPREAIVIGTGEGAIVVTLLSISGGRVRIGIEADKTIAIRRLEMLETN